MSETEGVSLANVPSAGAFTDLVGLTDVGGGRLSVRRIPQKAVASTIAAFANKVTVGKAWELNTLANYAPFTGAEVHNDEEPLNGVYAKSGPYGTALWVRLGPLRSGPAGEKGEPGVVGFLPGRPGDVPSAFSTLLSGGSADVLPPLDGSEVVLADNGRAVRFRDPVALVTRKAQALEVGRAYRLRYAVQRRGNTNDPANDALTCGVLWLDGSLGIVSSATINAFTSLTTGSGRQVQSVVVARASGANVDLVAPASARYLRAFVQKFGGVAVDDVEVIEVEDVSDATLLPPASVDLSARIAAVESLDVGDRLDQAEAALSAPHTLTFATMASAQAATVPGTVTTIRLIGSAAIGDGTDSIFVQTSGDPAPALGFKTANNRWFVITARDASDDVVTVEGVAKKLRDLLAFAEPRKAIYIQQIDPLAGTPDYDCTAAMHTARDMLVSYGDDGLKPPLIFPRGRYEYSTSPNWAMSDGQIITEGNVVWRHTGSGNGVVIDSGPGAIAGQTRLRMGHIVVESGPGSGGHGVYVRAMHHSHFDFKVKGCGTGQAGLFVAFGVCTEFKYTCSRVEGPWYLDAQPEYGMYLTSRPGDPLDYAPVSYCTFPNPIIEGTRMGAMLDNALGCRFTDGTIEACTALGGMVIGPASALNVVDHVDFENNASFDVYILGDMNVLQNVQATGWQDTLGNGAHTRTDCLLLGSGANGNRVVGGHYNSINLADGSTNNLVADLCFNTDLTGVLFDGGSNNRIRSLYQYGAGRLYDA